jgi:hypothetical protein
MTAESRIRPRDRDAVLQSLRAGVVPRAGLHHIQVGRVAEVSALLKDIGRVADGGSALRFIVGEYGSGKTFFMFLMRSVALEKKLVTVHADLTPDRRLQSTGGQARSLYAELMRNMATRAKPDGGALPNVVEKFVSSAQTEAQVQGATTDKIIRIRLQSLSELTGGYDFAAVIGAYWRGHEEGNETLQNDALRWLRGEFTSKMDARSALGVRTIIDDAGMYDHLKLLARFVRLAGYAGLLVCLDEMVNLYKLTNPQSRSANYEQILRILNDSLQGSSVGLGFLLGGTPEFITDPRRGLYSYAALASRLAANTFAVNGLKDYSGPVLSLANLTPEDFYVLLRNLRHVYAGGDPAAYMLPDEALSAFMEHCARRVGDAYFRTPRTTITAFINLLAVLEQNPHVAWSDLIAKTDIKPETNPDTIIPSAQDTHNIPSATIGTPAGNAEDDLATFRL